MQEQIDYILATGLAMKFLWNGFVAISSIVFAYLGLEQGQFLPITILVAIDMIVGPMHAKVVGKKFSIDVWIDGLWKKVSLLIFPVTIALGGIAMGKDASLYVDASIYAITMSVLYGVWQNLYSIQNRGKKELPDIDFINIWISKMVSDKKGEK